MDGAVKLLSLFGLVFLLQFLLWNFIYPTLPRLPGDVSLRSTSFPVYIPFTSTIIISVALTFAFQYFTS